MEEINLKELFMYIRKYMYIIILSIIVFLSISIFYDLVIKKPLYTTYTSIVLVKDENSSIISSKNSTIDQNDIMLNQKLVSTYRQIIKSKLVLKQVIDNLKLQYKMPEMYSKVTVDALEDTEILKVSVVDRNPDLSAKIANEIAKVFEKEVIKIYKLSNVSIIDKAEVPSVRSNNSLIKDIILAIILGIVCGGGIIFIIFYFDDTIRSIDTIDSDIGIPLIAKIFRDNNKLDLVVNDLPKSNTSESIRTLRTNLQFASVDKELKTLLFTSTMPSEGKSFISSNLAVSFAETNKKVLIIDCDLRKGRQHDIFKISRRKGLSNLLASNIDDYYKYIYKTKIKNLCLIPRGVIPPNPSELLSSNKMKTLIEKLKKDFDIVILDGAPSNGLSDSLALSALVDDVVLVTSINYTPKRELMITKKALSSVGANLAGVVVNNIKAKKHGYSGYYYGYGYGYEYGYEYGEEEKND